MTRVDSSTARHKTPARAFISRASLSTPLISLGLRELILVTWRRAGVILQYCGSTFLLQSARRILAFGAILRLCV